jgi:DNA-binding response OmpR family regulator
MSSKCPECQRLELAYETSIQEIHAVVNGSFKTVREKLNRLFQKQDIRDQAIRSLHTHKKTHYRKSVPDDNRELEADSSLTPKNLTPSQAKLHMLLLTTDPLLVNAFTGLSREIGVEAQTVGDSDRFSHRLSNARYEGVLLDFDTVPAAISVLCSIRKGLPSKTAVIFAVATAAGDRDRALQDGAHFLLQRPIDSTEIRRTLSIAYDLMCGRSRRDFRCAAELPVSLTFTTSQKTIQCSTMNVSSNGMAVKTPFPLRLAETMDIVLLLPEMGTLLATGIVAWHDEHGKCGLKVQCNGPEMRQKLDSWLDSNLPAMKQSAGLRWRNTERS